MGVCSSSAQVPTNLSSPLLSPASQNSLRPNLHRKSYTVRSPTAYIERKNPSSSSNHIPGADTNGIGRKRQNSITVAARSSFPRTPITTLVVSQSNSADSSLILSEDSSTITRPAEVQDTINTIAPSSASSNVISSNDISIQLVEKEIQSADVQFEARSPGGIQPTARERLFGTFEHRCPDFKVFYSRPEAFQYENSPFFRTVAKRFRPNMESGTLEGNLSTQREFVLQTSDVQVPEGECESRWFGKHVVHFYNSISVLYHRISRLCTAETCPKMHAGSQVEFRWQNEKGQIRTVSAPKYVKLLFSWIDKQISDPAIFPFPKSECRQDQEQATTSPDHVLPARSSEQVVFPEGFRIIAANILRKLWRVLAHLYYGHFKRIRLIGLEDELNIRFYHLAFFVLVFDLLPTTELRPLRSLIVMRLPEHLTSAIPW